MKTELKNQIKKEALNLKETKAMCKNSQRENGGSSILQYTVVVLKKEARMTLLMYALVREKDLSLTDKNWESFTTKEEIQKELAQAKIAMEASNGK